VAKSEPLAGGAYAAYAASPPLPARLRRVLGTDWLLGWAMVLPVLLIVLGLVGYPFYTAIMTSFQARLLGGEGTWVGLANYAALLSQQSLFLLAAVNTVAYTFCAVGLKFVLGMTFACVLNHHIVWRNFWRGLLFLPWAVPAIVAGFAWRFLYDTSGFVNTLVVEWKLRDDFIYFLSDPHLALPAVILVAVWTGTPFYTMNFVAGMQGISDELYEAAEIDGANTLQRFRYITLPGLLHVILITVMLSTIWTSSNITQIFVLTLGGPQHATTTVPFLSYEMAIVNKQLGAGAAISLLMVPAYLLLVIPLTRRMLRQEA
jgi:ABC-type sugar transport system permease subunit